MRLTIYIPKDLSDRLHQVKHLFNVSELCQQAIEREVDRRLDSIYQQEAVKIKERNKNKGS